MKSRWSALCDQLRSRSAGLVRTVENRLDLAARVWLAVVLAAGVGRVAGAVMPPQSTTEAAVLLVPYLLIALAPLAGFQLAERCFPRGSLSAQPRLRLAQLGRWRNLDPLAARSNTLYGPVGLMASLLIGIMLNVPVRTAEYLAAVPAVGFGSPAWAQVYYALMTGQIVVMNFFYMVCFQMALRAAPLFPRMLAYTWALDLALQYAMAQHLAAQPLPGEMIAPLVTLIHGNMATVLFSVMIWLPYLLLSERVNVTFRLRTAA